MTQDAGSHNVFISWSGDLSKRIALAVHDWLPTVIQAVNPFVSNVDIAPGARPMLRIAGRLQDIRVGILCVTPENQSAPWLNFEAGALSKMVDESYVIPLAFNIDKGQIRNPLGQFQAVQFTQHEMFRVASTINEAVAISVPLSSAKLERAFDLAWPQFSREMERIRTEHAQASFIEEPKRNAEDMLEELVVTVREQQRMLELLLEKQSLQIKAATNGTRFVGQRVFHPRFGYGTVLELASRKDGDQEILLDFERHGRKRLMESLANLEAAD
jgi:hypothetical protein